MTDFSPRILITGGSGQLAKAIVAHPRASEFTLVTCDKEELDICQPASIQDAINKHLPDIIINTAAYTSVDKAEAEVSLADHVNNIGAGQVALACQKNQIKLIHISTDYVFDGSKNGKYLEEDPPHPINIYGKSKLQGEEAIQQACKSPLILRVSGVFSEFGDNFLKTILKLARERTSLNVISDQITCPTHASDIAGALFTLCKYPAEQGIYHYCSDESVSRHHFAQAIVDEALKYESLNVKEVKGIHSAQFPTAAKRPAVSVLDCYKIKESFDIGQPSWREAIKRTIPKLIQEKA